MNSMKWGAFLAAAGVALSAFGAHGLQSRIAPEMLEIYKTATHYGLLHSFALILFGLAGIRKSWPARCFLGGICVFCGSLFALVASGIKSFGAITPIGGVLFIIGWLGFGWLAKGER